MDLPTYTNIWRIEKRLYKLYDFRLPMPLPLGQIAVFTAIAVPYVVVLAVLGLPFSHTLLWLYVLPPGSTHLARHPAGAGEQTAARAGLIPVALPRRAADLVPDGPARGAGRGGRHRPGVAARRAGGASRTGSSRTLWPAAMTLPRVPPRMRWPSRTAWPGTTVRDGDANRERRADRRERRAGQEERELEVAAQSAVARAAHGVQPIGVTAQARTRAPAVPGPVVPGSAVRAPAMPGSAVPGPAVRAPSDAWSRCTGHCGARTGRGWVRRARARGAAAGPRGQPWPVAGAAISSRA